MPSVFPAHAGMSRHFSHTQGVPLGFPRSRGDEPRLYQAFFWSGMFSPLTRG